MQSGEKPDHQTADGIQKILQNKTAPNISELLKFNGILKNAITEIEMEVKRKDYEKLTIDSTTKEIKEYEEQDNEMFSFLVGKGITPHQSRFYFYMLFMHIHNKRIESAMNIFNILIRIFKQYQQPVSIYHTKDTNNFLVMFNGPHFKTIREYKLSEFELEAKHLSNVIIVTQDYEIYPSMEYFIKMSRRNSESFLLQHTFTTKEILRLVKDRDKIFKHAKVLLDMFNKQILKKPFIKAKDTKPISSIQQQSDQPTKPEIILIREKVLEDDEKVRVNPTEKIHIDTTKEQENPADFISPSVTQFQTSLKIAKAEMASELKTKDGKDKLSNNEENEYNKLQDKINYFLQKKNIFYNHPFYFFYISHFCLYSNLLNSTWLTLATITKMFKNYQQSVSIYLPNMIDDLLLIFNGPALPTDKKYSMEHFKSKSFLFKNTIVMTNNAKLFYSFDKFLEYGKSISKEGIPYTLTLQATLTSEMVKKFAKNINDFYRDVKKFHDELLQEIKAEQAHGPWLQLKKELETKLTPRKNISPVTKREDPHQILLKEIRQFEKLSPIEQYKDFKALQVETKSVLNKSIQEHFQNHEMIIDNYLQSSAKAIQKYISTNTKDKDYENKFTIKEFQVLYAAFIKHDNVEEKRLILQALRQIHTELNTLHQFSFNQLKKVIHDTKDKIADELKAAKKEFNEKHQEIFQKLTLLRSLHKEAEITNHKKLQQSAFFSKKQSIQSYFNLLLNHKKIVDKSTQDEISIIKQHTAKLDQEFKIIDDKINILNAIFQPKVRQKKPSKPSNNVKKEVEKKTDTLIPESPATNNVVEELEEEIIPAPSSSSSSKKSRKKHKKNEKSLAKKIAAEKLKQETTEARIAGLKKLGIFKPVPLSTPTDSKEIPLDFTIFSYGLLIRCHKNPHLYTYADNITHQISSFSANKELLSEPHISLFYVEDVRLNNEKTRENIKNDLQKLFEIMPLPSELSLTNIAIFGINYNENKFLSVEIEKDERLNELQEHCIRIFHKHGIAIQKKYDFKPHITLGYSKKPLSENELNGVKQKLEEPFIQLDVAVFNRKPPAQKGFSSYLLPLEELETFELNTENTRTLKLKT